MAKWEIQFGGSVIVDADDRDEAEERAYDRITSDSSWANIRKVKQLDGDIDGHN